MRSQLFIALGVVTLAGCGSGDGYKPEPVKPVASKTLSPGDEASLFPLSEGNQWTYAGETDQRVQGRTGRATFELTFKVIKVTKTGDRTLADIEVTNNSANAKKDIQRWELSSKGLYQIGVGNPLIAYNPPQPIILFPAEEGRKFSWKGAGMTPAGRAGQNSFDAQILPIQEVDTETERLSALCVSTKGTFSYDKTKGQVASMSYWSPKVGLVRFRQEVVIGQNAGVQLLKLKASTVR